METRSSRRLILKFSKIPGNSGVAGLGEPYRVSNVMRRIAKSGSRSITGRQDEGVVLPDTKKAVQATSRKRSTASSTSSQSLGGGGGYTPNPIPNVGYRKRVRGTKQWSGSSYDENEHQKHRNATEDTLVKDNWRPDPVEPEQSSTQSVATSTAGELSEYEEGSTFKCGICLATNFRNKGHYRNHLEVHEGKRPYLCPICNWGCEEEVKVLEHMSRNHFQEPAFKCAKCGAEYKTERGLFNHELQCL